MDHSYCSTSLSEPHIWTSPIRLESRYQLEWSLATCKYFFLASMELLRSDLSWVNFRVAFLGADHLWILWVQCWFLFNFLTRRDQFCPSVPSGLASFFSTLFPRPVIAIPISRSAQLRETRNGRGRVVEPSQFHASKQHILQSMNFKDMPKPSKLPLSLDLEKLL